MRNYNRLRFYFCFLLDLIVDKLIGPTCSGCGTRESHCAEYKARGARACCPDCMHNWSARRPYPFDPTHEREQG